MLRDQIPQTDSIPEPWMLNPISPNSKVELDVGDFRGPEDFAGHAHSGARKRAQSFRVMGYYTL